MITLRFNGILIALGMEGIHPGVVEILLLAVNNSEQRLMATSGYYVVLPTRAEHRRVAAPSRACLIGVLCPAADPDGGQELT